MNSLEAPNQIKCELYCKNGSISIDFYLYVFLKNRCYLKSANGMAMKFGITIQWYQQRNTLKIQRSNIQNV